MPHDTAMGSGIQAALDCHTTCLETISHCLAKGGDHARPDHIKLLIDCAEICQTAANFMARESDTVRGSAWPPSRVPSSRPSSWR